MAVRLSVVISQAAQRTSHATELEETLVTSLIFQAGLDPTLVGNLERIETGATDHLCLEGIRGDFALLAWGPSQDAIPHLTRLGVFGRPGKVPGAAAIEESNWFSQQTIEQTPAIKGTLALPPTEQWKRRIYYIDLSQSGSSQEILDKLTTILKERQVIAVPLQLTPPKTSSASSSAKTALPVIQANSTPTPIKPATAKPATASIPKPPPAAKPNSATDDSHDPDRPANWQELDRLVDDLDAMQL